MKRSTQLKLLRDEPSAYGGDLLKSRKGRAHGRPLHTKHTIHLVLRSTKAKGAWSFKKHENEKAIELIFRKFSSKYGIKVLSLANVGNHLHAQIKLTNRFGYAKFIRAITGAIAQAVTGQSRWRNSGTKLNFWDRRPFTRAVKSFRAYLNLRDYIRINQLEGFGYSRDEARVIISGDLRGP
jgi:REP element-mobilizing transposase RayT